MDRHFRNFAMSQNDHESHQDIVHNVPSPPQQGYDPSCLKDPELAKRLFCCGLCHKVARKAVELSCAHHEDDLKLSVYCETCLSSYLQQNDNKCPATHHPKATYDISRALRRQILSLDVICPHAKPQFRTPMPTAHRLQPNQRKYAAARPSPF